MILSVYVRIQFISQDMDKVSVTKPCAIVEERRAIYVLPVDVRIGAAVLRGYVKRCTAFIVLIVYIGAKLLHKEAGCTAVTSCGDDVEVPFTISAGARHEPNKALGNV